MRFNEHLEKPIRFYLLAHVRELVAILEHHGISVRMLKASRVGYIVYEDEFQIAAEPFADTRC